MKTERIILTTCGNDCGASCILYVEVDAGGIPKNITTQTEVTKNGKPPLTACVRGLSKLKSVYHKDRLLYPLIRKGPRGKNDSFQQVDWDEALDLIAEKLGQTKKEFGNQAILGLAQEVTLHAALHNPRGLTKRFLNYFGGHVETIGHLSAYAAEGMTIATYGDVLIDHPKSDILNTNLILLWDSNPLVTRRGASATYYLREAKNKGIKIIVVDPVKTRTAEFANEWIPIRPGTDSAMLLAMAYTIINENLHDTKFLEKHTHGFQVFADYLTGKEDGCVKDPKWAEGICGVPAEKISALAIAYANAKPALLYPGWAAQRDYRGEQYIRAAMMLPILTGNIGIPGGGPAGVNFGSQITLPPRSIPRPNAPPRYPFDGALAIPHNETGILIPVNQWVDYVLDNIGTEREIKFIYSASGNLLNQTGDANKAIKAFESADFIVQHELFMTPTAKYADIILPVSSFMERTDLFEDFCWYEPYYIYQPKIIEPRGESKTDLEMLTLLAERLGFVDKFNPKYKLANAGEMEWLTEFIGESEMPGFTIENLQKEGIYWPETPDSLPFERQVKHGEPFATPTGKIEIFSKAMAEANIKNAPPIPKWIDDSEIPDWDIGAWPLRMISPPSLFRTNSTFSNIEISSAESEPYIFINVQDAKKRNIKESDRVKVFNEVGSTEALARVGDNIIEGCVALPQGRWFELDNFGHDTNGSANILTKTTATPYVGAFAVNTCFVEIIKK